MKTKSKMERSDFIKVICIPSIISVVKEISSLIVHPKALSYGYWYLM